MGQTGRSRRPRLCVHQAWTRPPLRTMGGGRRTRNTHSAIHIPQHPRNRYLEYVGVLCVLGFWDFGRCAYVGVCARTRCLGGRVFGVMVSAQNGRISGRYILIHHNNRVFGFYINTCVVFSKFVLLRFFGGREIYVRAPSYIF